MLDADYQVLEIKKTLAELSSIFYELHKYDEFKDEILSQFDSEEQEYEAAEVQNMQEQSFLIYAKKLKLLVLVFFEGKQRHHFFELFLTEISTLYQNDKSILSARMEEGNYAESNFLNAYRFYLAVFPEFSDNDAEILKRTGLIYLTKILENTAVVIEEMGKKPRTEVEVYKAVKIVCEATFPSIVFPSNGLQTTTKDNGPAPTGSVVDTFQKTVKRYVPDILLPGLNCAVEFKYADTEKKLIETIDQILIDVKGYQHHHVYKIFYAVFYVKAGIWSKSRFDEVWNEKGFPENWKGIIVQASF